MQTKAESMTAPHVRHALNTDRPRLARSLASAFADDPVMCWLFQEAAPRNAQLLAWMEFSLGMGLTRGHVYHAGDGDAVAIWSPPDISLFDELWAPRMVELMRELIGDAAGAKMAGMAQAFTQGNVEEPHFYLFMLGTDAGSQGRGLGSVLVERVLRTCDEQGLAAHLESSNPRNIPFYQRHGFEVVSEVRLGGDGPLICPMRRPAGTG